MWLKLLLQLRELLPLVGRLLPLLEGWVAGNSGAAQANTEAIKQLESRVAASQDGLQGQLRQHSEALLAMQRDLADLRHKMVANSAEQQQKLAEIATDVARLQLLAKVGLGLLAVLLVGAMANVYLLLHLRV